MIQDEPIAYDIPQDLLDRVISHYDGKNLLGIAVTDFPLLSGYYRHARGVRPRHRKRTEAFPNEGAEDFDYRPRLLY